MLKLLNKCIPMYYQDSILKQIVSFHSLCMYENFYRFFSEINLIQMKISTILRHNQVIMKKDTNMETHVLHRTHKGQGWLFRGAEVCIVIKLSLTVTLSKVIGKYSDLGVIDR